MKRSYFFCLLLFLISTTYAENFPIAVNDLDAAGLDKSTVSIISDRLRTELFNTGKFTVIERNQMEEILKEQGFQQSGCTNNDCAVEIGQLLGVKYMFAGKIGKVGKTFTLSIRMIDVQTGKILLTSASDCKCPIDDVLSNSTKVVAMDVAEKVSKLNNPVVTNKTSIVEIISKPKGATLFIANDKKGKTPYTDTMEVGKYPISLQLKNHKTINDQMVLLENETFKKSYTFSVGKEKSKSSKRKIIPFTISGLALVGGIVGGVILNSSASDKLDESELIKADLVEKGTSETFDYYNSLYKKKVDDARDDMVLRSVCYGVAGLGGLGIIFTIAF